MKRTVLFLACALLLAPLGVRAQSVEPEEAEIVLPAVLLEIEDLSVESVTAGVPEDEEQTPVLDFPFPEPEEIQIAEPSIDITLPATGVAREEQRRGKQFSAEAEVGLGTENHFFSRLSLYSLGERPEGRLLFQHETLDGFSSKDPGEGFSMREDLLEGGIALESDKFGFSADGSFAEVERGLQGRGTFYSKINRSAGFDGGLSFRPAEWFVLKGAAEAAVANQLLTGGGGGPARTELEEFVVAPSLAAEFHFRNGHVGISPRLSYRGVPDRDVLSTERFETTAYTNFEFNEAYRFGASAGWHYGGATGHLFVFDAGLDGRFSEVLSLGVKGGYRVEELNLGDLFGAYHFMDFPSALIDNTGWFFEARGGWIAFQGFTIDAAVSISDNERMPTFDTAPDPTSGLFSFRQVEAMRTTTDLGVRWNLSEVVSTRLGWTWEIADRPSFLPEHRVFVEATAEQKLGRFGAGISGEQLVGTVGDEQAPVVGVSGFVQATDFMRFTLEMGDLLYPLLDGPRYDWYPYVGRGFTLTVKALVSF